MGKNSSAPSARSGEATQLRNALPSINQLLPRRPMLQKWAILVIKEELSRKFPNKIITWTVTLVKKDKGNHDGET